MILPQQMMIDALRCLCREDTRVEAAMFYGSFAYDEADEFSDLDILLYFTDDVLKDIDQTAWVAQIQPVALSYVNDFGIRAVVFDNLVRGEFHFDPASRIPDLERFHGELWFPPSAILFDRSGRLTQHLQALAEKPQRDQPETRDNLCKSFLNHFLFGLHVLARGEAARAVELLVLLDNKLLHMTRLDENCTDHWHTPSRAVERDLSPAAYTRLIRCTAALDKPALWDAYRAAWQWGEEWIQAQNPAYDGLIEKIDQRISEYGRRRNS